MQCAWHSFSLFCEYANCIHLSCLPNEQVNAWYGHKLINTDIYKINGVSNDYLCSQCNQLYEACCSSKILDYTYINIIFKVIPNKLTYVGTDFLP